MLRPLIRVRVGPAQAPELMEVRIKSILFERFEQGIERFVVEHQRAIDVYFELF